VLNQNTNTIIYYYIKGHSNYQIGPNRCKSDQIRVIYYQNQERFITYTCQKDNEHRENWTKWELGLHIVKSEPLLLGLPK